MHKKTLFLVLLSVLFCVVPSLGCARPADWSGSSDKVSAPAAQAADISVAAPEFYLQVRSMTPKEQIEACDLIVRAVCTGVSSESFLYTYAFSFDIRQVIGGEYDAQTLRVLASKGDLEIEGAEQLFRYTEDFYHLSEEYYLILEKVDSVFLDDDLFSCAVPLRLPVDEAAETLALPKNTPVVDYLEDTFMQTHVDRHDRDHKVFASVYAAAVDPDVLVMTLEPMAIFYEGPFTTTFSCSIGTLHKGELEQIQRFTPDIAGESEILLTLPKDAAALHIPILAVCMQSDPGSLIYVPAAKDAVMPPDSAAAQSVLRAIHASDAA